MIWHGFATIVNAEYIGENCEIWQQVTIGENRGCPHIGNNVRIHAGAIVAGPITIGDGAEIGANAVVLKDVPKNALMAGVPAKVIRIK